MIDFTRKKDAGYIAYEYREVMVAEEFLSIYRDSYPCFGWEEDPNHAASEIKDRSVSHRTKPGTDRGRRVIYFRRNRNISNKAELTRLQRNFDSCIQEIEELNRSKTTMGLTAALVVGILGTACMAGSVFAVTAEPPVIWLMVLLAIPGLIGWILPCYLYRRLVRKNTEEINPLIEQKYDEIYTICEKGNNLLI